jgi:hypothetical protein
MDAAAGRSDTRAMNRRVTDSAQSVASSLRRLRRPDGVAAAPAAASGLSTCVACGRDFVTPARWEEVGDDRWWMLLRCAECGIWREVTVPNAVAERYDDELVEGARTIADAARGFELGRMAAEVDAFAAALHSGLIEPTDFAR